MILPESAFIERRDAAWKHGSVEGRGLIPPDTFPAKSTSTHAETRRRRGWMGRGAERRGQERRTMRGSRLSSDLPPLLFSGSASLRLCARPNPLIPKKDGGRSPPYRCRPVSVCSGPLWRKTTHVMQSPDSSCLSPCLRGGDIGIVFGFYGTYARPEASFMRQGTVLTVPVESPPVLTYSDVPWGWAPDPGIFRVPPMARRGVSNLKCQVSSRRSQEPRLYPWPWADRAERSQSRGVSSEADLAKRSQFRAGQERE